MYVKKRRGLVALAAITASVALSGIGASGASALGAPCSGSSIEGQGSSLQGTAQSIWTTGTGIKGFNNNMTGGGCTTSPTVRYTVSSSGSCLSGFGGTGGTFNGTFAFCGTDDAPNTAQIATINTASGSKVINVPVTQAAIAVVANPPASCTISSVTATNLEQAFRGTITTWTALGGTGAGCSSAITTIHRADSSGTTYQFKHFLFTQFSGNVLTSPNRTWADLQSASTTWPVGILSSSGCLMTCSGSPGSGSGGGDEVKSVGATAGSLGYAALADARTQVIGTTYSGLKWLAVRRETGAAIDPSTNGIDEARAQSNCATGTGVYGTLPDTTSSWADVYYNSTTNYPICTLTWDLALSNYGTAFPGAGVGTGVATTVRDYLKYVTAPNGGQLDITNNDYQALPEDVATSATAGINMITG